jgi:hypothetical protein
MFWTLWLAHLIGDYPLQTDWIMKNKRSLKGLGMHVAIHLLLLLILAGENLPLLWPYILLVAFLHLLIDVFKNWVWARWPDWVAGPYLFDQFLHALTLLLVVALVKRAYPSINLMDYGSWTIYACGFLLATYVWYISERVLVHADPAYQEEVLSSRWSRMAARALLLAAFLALGQGFWRESTAPALSVTLPYTAGVYRRRALAVDFIVALSSAGFIFIAS